MKYLIALALCIGFAAGRFTAPTSELVTLRLPAPKIYVVTTSGKEINYRIMNGALVRADDPLGIR